MRVLLDTNVIVSAILFGGLPHECLRRGLAGKFELVTSSGLLDELERVLRDRFGLSKEAVAFVRRDLELAADGRADHIVTGDQDLLVIGRYEETEIVTPSEFVRRFPVQSVEK